VAKVSFLIGESPGFSSEDECDIEVFRGVNVLSEFRGVVVDFLFTAISSGENNSTVDIRECGFEIREDLSVIHDLFGVNSHNLVFFFGYFTDNTQIEEREVVHNARNGANVTAVNGFNEYNMDIIHVQNGRNPE
jgi:hypothetical protein